MIGFLLWTLFDLLLQMALEVVFGLLHAFDEDESSWPLAVLLFVSFGVVLGGVTAWAFPTRLLEEGPFQGVSLVAAPVLLGAFMEGWGALIEGKGRRTSHLATWYGGASMGLGLAIGRFGVMKLVGSV